MAIPKKSNPLQELTGANCGVGQDGAVWIKTCGFGSSKIQRVCTVPEGTALFFTMVSMINWVKNTRPDACAAK
ncbi:MAG: hypothetical protein ACU843_18460 [Gammaproteobacteria bacterium]